MQEYIFIYLKIQPKKSQLGLMNLGSTSRRYLYGEKTHTVIGDLPKSSKPPIRVSLFGASKSLRI